MFKNNRFMRRSFFILSLFFCALVLLPHSVLAMTDGDDIINRFRKPMPELPLLSKEAFEEKTTLYSGVPYNDQVLAYSVRVAKEWTKAQEKGASNFLLSNRLFSTLALFHSPPSVLGRSRLEIKAVNLEHQITAEQWYIQYILESGYTTEGFVVHSKKKAESLMIVMEQDISYMVRSVIQINGKRAVLVEYYIPLMLWHDNKVMQEQVLSSFTLPYLKDEIIEELVNFQFLDVAQISYPESWKPHTSPLRSVERMSLKIMNVREIFDKIGRKETATEGQVDVAVVAIKATESFIKEIEVYKRKLEASGILVGDRIERIDDIKYKKDVRFAITEVYKGIDSTSDYIDYELWFSAMASGDYFFFVTLITPGRNEAFSTWARNSESYRIMVETMVATVHDFEEGETDGNVQDISNQ